MRVMYVLMMAQYKEYTTQNNEALLLMVNMCFQGDNHIMFSCDFAEHVVLHREGDK